MIKHKKNEQVAVVSIIMPCFNVEAFVDRAIESVLRQTYNNWELLVCDDGSDDATSEILANFAKRDARIRMVSQKFDRGAAGARNSCIDEATGQYISFLDADDEWLPFKLERQLEFMIETGEPFVFGYCQNINEAGDEISITKAPDSVSFNRLLFCNFIPCLTVIYDSRMLGKTLQPNIKKRNDFALWLRILGDHRDVHAHCYPEVVARYRVNKYGLSANKISGIEYFYRCLRQYAGLNVASAIFCTFSAIGFKAMKTLSPRMYNLAVTKLL